MVQAEHGEFDGGRAQSISDFTDKQELQRRVDQLYHTRPHQREDTHLNLNGELVQVELKDMQSQSIEGSPNCRACQNCLAHLSIRSANHFVSELIVHNDVRLTNAKTTKISSG